MHRALVGIAGLLILLLSPWALWGPADVAFRVSAMGLEVAGLCTVAVGLLQTRTRFGLPPVAEPTKRYWYRVKALVVRHVLRRPPISVTVTADAVSSHWVASDAHASTWKRAPDAATSDERLRVLEENLEALRGRFEWGQEKSRVQFAGVAAGLEAESARRTDSIRQLNELVRDEALGGLRLEAFGLLYLVMSAIVGGTSQALAAWLL